MRKLCLYGTLILFCSVGFAQTAKNTLKPGSAAPKIEGVIRWIKGTPFTEFQKGKIYVVEFGATWCGPCVAAIPSLTAIAQQNPDEVIVQSFFVMESNTEPVGTKNPKYVKRVEEFVAARKEKIGYNIAVDGPEKMLVKNWIEAAGRAGIPQTFIVDRDGKIAWIGSNPKLLDSVVQAVRKTGYYTQALSSVATVVAPDTVDNTRPIFRSELSWYTGREKENENIPYVENFYWAKSKEMKAKQGTIQVRGENLRRLYFMAYGDTLWDQARNRLLSTGEFPDTIVHPEAKRSYGRFWYKPLLRLEDSTIFEADGYLTTLNRFNYNLTVPMELSSSKNMRSKMQEDLKRYFGFNVSIERKAMPCWYLTASDVSRRKLETKTPGRKWTKTRDKNNNYVTHNGLVADLISNLELRYGYTPHGLLVEHPELQPPFFDATGIHGEIDYKTSYEKIQKMYMNPDKASTFEEYRAILREMGIELVKGRKVMNVIIITEPGDADQLRN